MMLSELLYNSKIKEEFLDNYPSNSMHMYESLFLRSSSTESKLKKDIFDFNEMEIVSFFKNLGMRYKSTARSYGRILTIYIDFAIKNNYKKNNNNPLRIETTKWFENFVDDSVNVFFNISELEIIEQHCVNPQDAVIFRLLFEGVQGKACSELRNLKKSDINYEDEELTLTDADGSTRILGVTTECLELIDEAIEQTIYYKSNGQMQERENIRNYTDLIYSEFVIRSSNTGKNKIVGAVDRNVIYRRISTIEKTYGDMNPSASERLNAKNISRSGMIFYAQDIMRFDNITLRSEIMKRVSKKFNISPYILGEFITERNISRLYNNFNEWGE